MRSGMLLTMLMALGLAGIAGCEEQGPAEQAGERLDDAVSDARDRLEEAGDEIEEAAEEVGDALRDN